METKKRIEFIDLAKGVCILLVIMMHTDVNVDFPGLRFTLFCQACFSKIMEDFSICW